METSSWRVIFRQIPWVIVASIVGALVFVLVQRMAGFSIHIGQYIGSQIVEQGGYDPSLKELFGWGIHYGVSLSYAGLFAAVTMMPDFPRAWSLVRWLQALAVAALLGWVTTLITEPAIVTTISVFAGKGWPEQLPGLNTRLGLPFWNHMGFFGICFVFITLIPDILRGRNEMRQF